MHQPSSTPLRWFDGVNPPEANEDTLNRIFNVLPDASGPEFGLDGAPLSTPHVRARTLTDWYCVLLMTVLLGYVFIGKGFAYQGIPPLLVGEFALVTGAFCYLLTGTLFATLSTLSARLLAALMVWVVIRTVPYIGEYGIDAPRDAVVVMYGAFAFITLALLLENKNRLNDFLAVYTVAATVYVLSSPVVFLVTRFLADYIPTFSAPSGEPISLWSFRPGQFGVHLGGAALFAFLGLQKVNFVWFIAFLATATMASATSRGAMLAIVVPILLVTVLGGRIRQLAKILAYCTVGLGAVLVVEIAYFDFRDVDTLSSYDRAIGVRQVISGVFSIFDGSGAQLSQTKEWRLRWWEIIQDHTLNGPYFWTGKGFGINLADADGFQQPNQENAPPLRDPHSVHITLLARAGVPGLVLWVGMLASWSLLLISTSYQARARGERKWADVLLFIFGYGVAVVVESTFDIGLAGPMMGIPFWSLFGLGIGAAMIYRAKYATADD